MKTKEKRYSLYGIQTLCLRGVGLNSLQHHPRHLCFPLLALDFEVVVETQFMIILLDLFCPPEESPMAGKLCHQRKKKRKDRLCVYLYRNCNKDQWVVFLKREILRNCKENIQIIEDFNNNMTFLERVSFLLIDVFRQRLANYPSISFQKGFLHCGLSDVLGVSLINYKHSKNLNLSIYICKISLK